MTASAATRIPLLSQVDTTQQQQQQQPNSSGYHEKSWMVILCWDNPLEQPPSLSLTVP